jgi:diguanylate cyclase (GGDEF)-like protein
MCLLPESPASGAAIVAERIRKRIAEAPVTAGELSIPTTVSIGVAAYPEHGGRFEVVAKNADRALYSSKANGRNRFTVFSPD